MNIFETFTECSLPSTVSKNTIKMIGHHGRLRDVTGQSYPNRPFWNSTGNWGEFQILTNRYTDTTTWKIMSRLIIWPSMMLLGWTETKLWTLNYGSKSIRTSLILRQHPPKPYKLLKFFISFVTTVKSRHAPTTWRKLRWKSLCLPILKSITEIMKNFKS